MAKILLTGASSFLGQNLTRRSVAAGHDVHIVTRPETDNSLLPEEVPAAKRHCHNGSMHSIKSIVQSVDPEIVFHIAGFYSRDAQLREVDRLVESNILFGTQLLEAMKYQKLPRKFLNAGSTFQYFHSPTPRALNLYAATKQAFESMLEYYREANGFAYLSIILPDLYGPNDWRDKLIYLLVDSAKTGSIVNLPDEDLSLNLLHVDDAAGVFLAAADMMLLGSDDIARNSYAATPQKTYRISELVTLISQLTGRMPAVNWGQYKLPKNHISTPWIGVNLPGWSPKIELQDGLKEIIGLSQK